VLVALAFTLLLSEKLADPPWISGESKPEDVVVDLVIFGPGRDVTGWFGHSALVVRDQRLARSRLYNYGEFSFDELMLAKYAMGHLQFWLGQRPVEHTFGLYRKEGRSITSLQLKLTPDERMAVARAVHENALPENKSYIYDHFTDNCATKPRDVVDRVIGGKLRAAAQPARMSLREHALRHTAALLPLGWLIDFMLNDHVDQPITTWEESFLPSELARNMRAIGLVEREIEHEPSEIRAREEPPNMWPPLAVLGVLVAAASIALRRRARALAWWTAVVGGLASIPGVALFVLWAFTDHFITYRNENILLSSPLTAIAAALAFVAAVRHARPVGEKAAKGARITWAVLAIGACVAVVIKALPWFDQKNAPHLVLFVPLAIGFAIAWRLRPVVALRLNAASEKSGAVDIVPPAVSPVVAVPSASTGAVASTDVSTSTIASSSSMSGAPAPAVAASDANDANGSTTTT
jgi:hypothetical protein